MVGKVSFKEIIGTEEEIDYLQAIKNFTCQDVEVETFLKTKALDFDQRNKSRTYLLIDGGNDNEIVILGYYTLTMKSLPFGAETSKSAKKKIDGFRSDVDSTEAVLIGQLGKNYNYKDKINGKIIIDYALDDIYRTQNIIGGRITFLECQNSEKVIKFYQENGFVFLQDSGEYLQMIRYL